MEFGEPCPWAGEGPARLTSVKGPDPGNSFPPSRRSFSSAFPLSSPFSAFPVLHSIFSSSLLRSRSCSPLPPVSPHPLPFWCRHFSAAHGGSESSPRSASSGEAVLGSRGSRSRLGGRAPEAAALGAGGAGPDRPGGLGRPSARPRVGGEGVSASPERGSRGPRAPLSRSE